MQKYTYRPQGICAMQVNVEIDDNGKVGDVEFFGGCDGNHKGIVSLVKGMDIDEVIDRLSGITCGRKKTSCPDQLAQALKQIRETQKKG